MARLPHRALLAAALLLLALVLEAPALPPGGAHRAAPAAAPACAPLPVAAGWALELCAASLRLRRLARCPPPAPPLRNGTAPHVLGLAQAQGPDELLVVLEGAEFHALEGAHGGGCEYAFPLPAPLLNGVYRVAIVLHREGWAALAEGAGAAAAFPPLVGAQLASCLVRLGPRGSSEALEGAREAALGRAPGGPPRCATAAARFGAGRWVRTRAAAGMFGGEGAAAPGAPPLRGWYAPPERAPFTSGLLLYTEVERDLAWAPYACAPGEGEGGARGALAALARRCLSGASLRFQGDSQLRTLYNDVLQRHCGIHNAAAKGLVHDVCVGGASGAREAAQGLAGENGTCPALASCFLADPWGEAPVNASSSSSGSSSGSSAPRAVVANLGQHSAARHEPADEFGARVEGYLRGARGGPALLLVEAQPFPVRYSDSGVLLYADGRTQPRLRLYNTLAAAAAARAGVPVLRTWDMAAPVVEACPDGAHFNGVYSVLDALGGRLLAALCPDLPV
jgi:hypothetical protein